MTTVLDQLQNISRYLDAAPCASRPAWEMHDDPEMN